MWLLMPSVRREVTLPVEPERAWELITDPEELEGWLADEHHPLAQQPRVDVERALPAGVLLHHHRYQGHMQPPSCVFSPW